MFILKLSTSFTIVFAAIALLLAFLNIYKTQRNIAASLAFAFTVITALIVLWSM